MPNDCFNSLIITHLLPDQKTQIAASFERSEDSAGEATSHFLETFCPEPDYSVTPVAKTYPSIAARFETDPEKLVQILRNEPRIRENAWWDWRVQNWGTKWELYDVALADNTCADEFSFSCYSAWSPPMEGLLSISKQFPNALFQLEYQESGEDFCGVTVFQNGIAYDYTHEISVVKQHWLQEYHPDLFARTQAEGAEDDSELEDELFDFWCDHEEYAIDWILSPVAECLLALIANPNPPVEPIELTVGSQVVTIPVTPWIPDVPITMSEEQARDLVNKALQSQTQKMPATV